MQRPATSRLVGSTRPRRGAERNLAIGIHIYGYMDPYRLWEPACAIEQEALVPLRCLQDECAVLGSKLSEKRDPFDMIVCRRPPTTVGYTHKATVKAVGAGIELGVGEVRVKIRAGSTASSRHIRPRMPTGAVAF